MWVDYKPIDVEIGDYDTGIFHVFELRIGMNEFDHHSFLLLFFSAMAFQRSGFQSLFTPEFFRPFSLLLKQQEKTAMIKFIHSYPQFKYMENSCIIITHYYHCYLTKVAAGKASHENIHVFTKTLIGRPCESMVNINYGQRNALKSIQHHYLSSFNKPIIFNHFLMFLFCNCNKQFEN